MLTTRPSVWIWVQTKTRKTCSSMAALLVLCEWSCRWCDHDCASSVNAAFTNKWSQLDQFNQAWNKVCWLFSLWAVSCMSSTSLGCRTGFQLSKKPSSFLWHSVSTTLSTCKCFSFLKELPSKHIFSSFHGQWVLPGCRFQYVTHNCAHFIAGNLQNKIHLLCIPFKDGAAFEFGNLICLDSTACGEARINCGMANWGHTNISK